MRLIKSKNANVNYLAKLVDISNFLEHPNKEYTKLKVAVVDGYRIVVSIDMKLGKYVYFPTMSQINPDLLSFLNLFDKPELNKDHTKKGFFNKNGRVKTIRLGGCPSEGFLMPISDLNSWLEDSVMFSLDKFDNDEFDAIEHNGKEFWVCRKYIIEPKSSINNKQTGQYRNNKLKKFNKLIDGQFKFHYDTVLIKKDPDAIKPNDVISITSKVHGTSGIFAYVLCKQPRSFFERLIIRLYDFFGGHHSSVHDTVDAYVKYDYIYSSRSVIKNNNINPTTGEGYYQSDVWKYAFEYIKPYLVKGMTIYAEIVGYLPNGKYIQQLYDYKCRQPLNENDYKQGVNFKVLVYRITMTNENGYSIEFSAKQVQEWCKSVGLTPVTQLYYGYACDLYPDIVIDDDWNVNFLDRLANDENFFMEKRSPDCLSNVPHEGIVIKKEDMFPHAWKLKTFAFLNKEQQQLDKGISNIEDTN